MAVEPRQRHRRDRLADLLWPKASVVEGRHSVATALSVLRGKFGPEAFDADRDQVRFAFPDLELDLSRLAQGDVLGDEFTPALDLGGFLEGFEISDAPEFQLWRESQRARWLPVIRDGFTRLIDLCRRTGDFKRIEILADRLLGLDDLSEEAIRAQMEARAFDGDRVGALRLYESWRGRLRAELGAGPSRQLEDMAGRLRRRGWEPPGRAHLPPIFTDQWKGRPFVGRGPQYRALYELWEHTLQSQARHALLLGDSGIGKSTLVERVVTAAGLEGAATSRVQCYELEREIPYAALAGLVRGLLDRPGVSATPAEWLAELAITVPDVRQQFSNLPTPPETHGESARLRLAEATHQLVMAVADENPVILVVDDLHLADDASIAVFHVLMRRTQNQRVMLVLTARPGELSRSPSAARLRENQRALGLHQLDLPPLTAEESAEVVTGLAAAAGVAPNVAVRRALVRAAAGYPMVLELLFQDWQTNGETCLALSVGAMTADAVSGGREDAYRQILERVIGSLDGVSRAVLDLAAILGARLNDLSMYALVDLSMAQTMAGMARLTEFRLLRDNGRALEFRNEAIRAHVYLNLPSPTRTALHEQIADRLLASEASGGEVSGLEIAWHSIRCGREEAATVYLLRGAREALSRGAAFDAEQALSSAMSWLQGSSRVEARLLLAEVLQDQGRWQESAAVVPTNRSELDDTQAEVAQALVLSADASAERMTSDQLMRKVIQLMDFVINSSSSRARVIAATKAGGVYSRVREPELGETLIKLLDGMMATAQGIDLARLLYSKGVTLYALRHVGRSLACVEKALSIVSDLGLGGSLKAQFQNGLGAICASNGQYEASITHFLDAHHTARDVENSLIARTAISNLALSYGRLGSYEQQLSWATRGIGMMDSRAMDSPEVICTYSAALASAMLGRDNDAVTFVEALEPYVTSDIPPWLRQSWGLYRADILLIVQGLPKALAAAQQTFDDVSDDSSQMHSPGRTRGGWLC